MSSRELVRISIATLIATASVAARAEAPAPDTSSWKCESCPFFKGYDAEATAGAIGAHRANASYGRYNGLDRDKTYGDFGADGQWRSGDGNFASYRLDDLGLDSRSGALRIGHEGSYDIGLNYDGQPFRRYDTTVSPFVGAALSLPAGWVAAGSTSGMTRLAASLATVDIGTLRKTYGIDGRWLLNPHVSLSASFRREDKTGKEILGASFLTQAMQLPAVVDYQTDTVEVAAAWSAADTAWRLALSNSKFKDQNAALAFANPYLPLVPGATTGQLALAPDNEARQASLTGSVALPYRSSVSLSLGYTELKQDAALLPASALPGATAPAGGFDGKVRLTHYGASLGSHPLSRLSLHGRIAYDERKDRSGALTIAEVVTDAVPGATVTTPRYDYERLRLDGGADYRLWRWLTVGVGGDRVEINRTQQVVRHTEDGRTYGKIRLAPVSSFSMTLKGGFAHRQARDIDLTLLPPGENPALGIYNLSNRDRDFFQLDTTWDPTAGVSIAVAGTFANDVYRHSLLGLREGRERRVDSTLSFAPVEQLTLYVDGGYQSRATEQAGQFSSASAPWQALLKDRFWNLGLGGHYATGRWDVAVDYAHAASAGATGVGPVGFPGAFPDLKTRYDNARLAVGYAVSGALRLRLRYVYQNYAALDWALDNVLPATIPNLLALGAPADSHNVSLVALSFSYRFGAVAPPPKSE
jgi:MtrB/PioB family decaheme-associated outer membrane protein